MGLDVELTPEVTIVFNGNLLRFHHTQSIEAFTFQPRIDKELGHELNLGTLVRPSLNNNVILAVAGSVFYPGKGFEQIFEENDVLYSVFAQVTLTY